MESVHTELKSTDLQANKHNCKFDGRWKENVLLVMQLKLVLFNDVKGT